MKSGCCRCCKAALPRGPSTTPWNTTPPTAPSVRHCLSTTYGNPRPQAAPLLLSFLFSTTLPPCLLFSLLFPSSSFLPPLVLSAGLAEKFGLHPAALGPLMGTNAATEVVDRRFAWNFPLCAELLGNYPPPTSTCFPTSQPQLTAPFPLLPFWVRFVLLCQCLLPQMLAHTNGCSPSSMATWR